MKKYLYILLFIFAVAAMRSVLLRELWFDEALTLLNFVLPLDWEKIYFSYTIPNNQIVYSMLLKIWDLFYIGYTNIVVHWRLLSVILSFGMFAVIIHLNRKIDEKRSFATILVLSVISLSAVFLNYATALRGYAASWFFVALSLLGLYNIFHNKARSGWAFYIISSILALGTVPTNLLALAAALLYAVPWMKKEFYLDKRAYIAAAVLPGSLLLFYLPIMSNFLAVCKLGEGFSNRNGASLVTLGMYAGCFGLLLIFGLFRLKKPALTNVMRYLIWLLPFVSIYVLHRAPFPRVFVTMLPVLCMLIIDGTANLINSDKWRFFHRVVFFLIIIASQPVMLITGATIAEMSGLSRYEDDFFHPWYMFPGYKVSAVVEVVKEIPATETIFISFSADPAPILFYAASNSLEHRFQSDIPFGSVKTLPDNAVLILRSDEDSAVYEKRFAGKLEKTAATKLHTVFRLRK